MSKTYYINCMNCRGVRHYSVTVDKKVTYKTTSYSGLVAVLQGASKRLERIGIRLVLNASTKALTDALNEDVYAYTY